MEAILFTLWIMLLGPVAMFFFLRKRLAGKMLCLMLEKDRSAKNILVRVEGDFVNIDGDKYFVDSEAVRLIRYPGGWPTPLQHVLPTCLYQRDGVQPINWNTQSEISKSSKEVTAALDPHIFSAIVRGTREGGAASSINMRPILIVLGVIGIVTLLTVFYVLSQINGLQNTSIIGG